MKKIPSKKDWGSYMVDQDANYAYGKFGGKSNIEMQNAFFENVTERSEDLQFMPEVPFQYYMLGLKDYVSSDLCDKEHKPDAACCFLSLVQEKFTDNPEYILPIWDDIAETVKFVANNQVLYDADIDIYDDFIEQLSKIDSLVEKAKR